MRSGLTDKRVLKIKSEAENESQELLIKQCNDYINEREEDSVELQTRIKGYILNKIHFVWFPLSINKQRVKYRFIQ